MDPRVIAADSWKRRRSNPAEQIVFPETDPQINFYVRTALIRPKSWRPGSKGPVVKTASKIAEILAHTALLDHERVILLMLDNSWKLIGIQEAAVGGLHGCALTSRDIMRAPALLGASKVIVTHNHPSGDPTPSRDDIVMTNMMLPAYDIIGIDLVDHIVITRTGYRSIMSSPDWSSRGSKLDSTEDVNITLTPSEELALKPYGKLAKFVVRTALIESPDRERTRHRISSAEDFVRLSAVQELAVAPPALLTVAVDGRNSVLATHVKMGHPIDADIRSIYPTAAAVNASAVLLAQNVARGGSAVRIKEEMGNVGIPVLDHIVVDRSGYAT
jgi:DNA repair protein RadC